MKHITIIAHDLECLEYMCNIDQSVGDLIQVQDCVIVCRDPAQHLQFTSVTYLMAIQLDDVVERYNQQWPTGEGDV